MRELSNDKIEISEIELHDIISKAMANALKDDWLMPLEFTEKILNEHYAKIEKELHYLLNSDQEAQECDATKA